MFKPSTKSPRGARGARGAKRTGRDLLKKRIFKKRACKFCIEKVEDMNYIDYQRFQKFLTERGKIVPSRISGNCARHQRQLARAIKRARVAALVPFVST